MTGGPDVVESSVINEVLTEIYLNKPGEVFEDWNEVFRVHAVRSGQFERLESLTSVLQHGSEYFHQQNFFSNSGCEDYTVIDLEESDGVVNSSGLYFNVPHLRLDEDM